MKKSTTKRLATLRIIGIYATVGVLWIYTSDTLLGLLVQDARVMVKIAIFKGAAYIFLTSLLLYILIRRNNDSLARSEQALTERMIDLEMSQERLSLALTGSKSGIWDWNVKTGEV